MDKKIEIQILRCSGCDKKFQAIPSSGEATCEHCGEKYKYTDDGWYNAKFMPGDK